MTLEDKKLLIQDVMARLPYGTKFDLNGIRGSIHQTNIYTLYKGNDINNYICSVDFFGDGNPIDIEHFKPCLLPLSSMTEEQYESLNKSNCAHSVEYSVKNGFKCIYFKTYSLELIDWLNANHFDYRGLIEKGLAIDATDLNIY